MAREIVYLGADRAQIGSWRSSTSIAALIPHPRNSTMSVDAVRDLVRLAVQRGYTAAFTSAIPAPNAAPFISCGFYVHEELHLLRRDFSEPVESSSSRTRRARRSDVAAVLALDELAFDTFWRFDQSELVDATKATPRHRFHVTRTSPAVGYHITGLARQRGYLQRVAVHPNAQGQGWGRALVDDALLWLQRNNAISAAVNTQIDNGRAVDLYLAAGFVMESHRLQVLHCDFA